MIFPDIVEFVAVFYTELLDKQANSIGRLRLQVALFNVQHLVEKLAHMEAQAHFIGLRNAVRILAGQYPALAGGAEFQLIPIILSFFRRKGGPDFRHLKMADAHKLIFNLLMFSFQLHGIRQRLPAASATDSKMLTEWLQAIL